MSNNYLSEIKVINESDDYYLLSEWIGSQNELKYELTITSVHKSLKGLIDFEEYKRLNPNESSEELAQKEKQLLEAMRMGSKAMATEANDSTLYCYEFDIRSDDSIAISISVYEMDERILKTPLIDVQCRPVSTAQLMAQMYRKLVLILRSKDELIEKLTKEVKSVQQLRDKAIEELEEFTVKKVENDSIVFTKFVAILNQKKKRINELEQQFRQ